MDLPWYSVLVPLLVFIFIAHQCLITNFNNPKKSPPSPRKLPIIGNLHQLGSHPHRSLHKLSQKHGPVMLLHLGSKPMLVASSVDAARDIMKTHDLVWSSRPKSSIVDRLLYRSKDVAFSSGEYWRQVRSIIVLHLLSNKRVQSFRDVREEEISKVIAKIRQECDSLSSVIDLTDSLYSLTNNIISRVALGRKYNEGESGIDAKTILEKLVELIGSFNIGDYIPWLEWVNKITGLDTKVEKVAKELDAFLESVIEEHISRNNKGEYSAGEAKDLVDVLLEIQNGKETGFPLQRDSLKAILLDTFGAGTDTIHTTLDWTMTELLRQPRTMETLQNEVRQLAQGKLEITEDDLKNTHVQYLRAVIKESLRLHPPNPLLVPRESMEDVKLLGYYHVPARTQAFVNVWAIGRDQLLWENPEEYRPERFLNSDIDVKGLNFELIPFGAGRRGCPGSTFAIAVIELALARLVQKFNFSLPEGIKPEDLDMTESTGITVRRKSPLLVVATPITDLIHQYYQ
ncbi:cytochrome P450 71A4-like [Lycium ferocissimum]|uniref:cytochrome P450 71A4-like n=1 Tax=Lycium ferocissimum TaxID=112874 RepID=UPI00281594F3|nr:cytochrome P450 71A4-like [Lycium ferocissimum]